jgi:hypothetical protein
MQTLGIIKRGDTFAFTADLTDTATTLPLTGAAADLRCEGRHYMTDTLICEPAVAETVEAGTYLFTVADTTEWEPGARIYFDIEYTDGAVIASTETFYCDVEADITQ